MAELNNRNSPIEIEELCIRIGETPLVDNVSFDVPINQITTIIGPNGAGKSTLLKAIMGDIGFQSGLIKLNGHATIAKQSLENFSRNIAFLPQFSSLNFPFTVTEVVKLSRIPHSTGEVIDNTIVNECLDIVEMRDFSNRLYPELSGGEKQRVQIARVLAQIWRVEDCIISSNKNTLTESISRILILDEPSSSLDLGHQQMLMHFLKDFSKQGVTVLMVLHNLNTAANYSDHLICLNNGELLKQGTPEEIIQQPIVKKLFGINCQIVNNPLTGKPNLFEQ